MDNIFKVHKAYKNFPNNYKITYKTIEPEGYAIAIGGIIALDREYFTVNEEAGFDQNITFDNLISIEKMIIKNR